MLELDIGAILAELDNQDVEFLIIGGVAVGYHGYVRATEDVDLVPVPDSRNLKRLAEALKNLDAQIEDAEEFEAEELPNPLDPEALGLGGNWVLRTRLGRLDLMQWIGELPLWEQLSAAAIKAEIGDLVVKVISYADLIALKQGAGRPEDQTDLARLPQARGEE